MTHAANEFDAAVDVFLDELMHVQAGENFLIYVDNGTDESLCRAMETRAKARSVQTTVLRLEAGSLVQQSGQLADCFRSSPFDAACELSDQYFYHTPAWEAARRAGARIFAVGGLDKAAFTRCIAGTSHTGMFAFGTRLQSVLQTARQIRISTANGTDIRVRLSDDRQRSVFGKIIGRLTGEPGPYVLGPCGILSRAMSTTFLGGQLAFMPQPKTVEGTAVIDGYMWPPGDIGALDKPVVLDIKRGKVAGIGGCPEKSAILRNWFAKQRRAIWIEHFCIGFHPRATIHGKLLEAERTFGSISVGMGKVALHTDGVMKNVSLYADDVPIMEAGEFMGSLAGGKHQMLRTR